MERAVEKARADPVRFPYLSLVVVGMPNVRKSTLINKLRRLGADKGKVSAVGKTPGVTTAIHTRVKIFDDPPIYLVDTPGIFDPGVTAPVDGLKIALAGSTKDKFTASINVCDYLLFRLNNSRLIQSYPGVLGMPGGPTDCVYALLEHVAAQKDMRILFNSRLARVAPTPPVSAVGGLASAPRVVEPVVSDMAGQLDLDRAALYVLDMYRAGAFGQLTLDDCSPAAMTAFFAGAATR